MDYYYFFLELKGGEETETSMCERNSVGCLSCLCPNQWPGSVRIELASKVRALVGIEPEILQS